MTDTATTSPEPHAAEEITEHALGELSHIDPNSLEVGDNVREFANLNKPFLDSIAEHGVMVPITAIRRPDGVVEVRNGQRRTMAARKVGLNSVPVMCSQRQQPIPPQRRSTGSCTRSSPTTRSRT